MHDIDIACIDGCAGTYIAYYNDYNCQSLNYTATVTSLGGGQCKTFKNETYTNMKTFKAFCSITTTIPAQVDTYVVRYMIILIYSHMI